MLPFKNFSKINKTKEGHVIIDEPITFKSPEKIKKTKDGYVIIDEPLTFKKSLKEDSTTKTSVLHAAINHNYDMHGDNGDLGYKLRKVAEKSLYPHEKEHAHQASSDRYHIKRYTEFDGDKGTNGSTSLNYKLVHNHKLDSHEQAMHNAIKNHATPSGHEFHTFSGSSRDFEHLAKHTKDNIFHAPVHTSTSHDIETAKEFAHGKAESREIEQRHLMHIHVKPHDKVLHVASESDHPEEHETIIPSGTKLKYHNSSHETIDNRKFKVHHFSIHSQE